MAVRGITLSPQGAPNPETPLRAQWPAARAAPHQRQQLPGAATTRRPEDLQRLKRLGLGSPQTQEQPNRIARSRGVLGAGQGCTVIAADAAHH